MIIKYQDVLDKLKDLYDTNDFSNEIEPSNKYFIKDTVEYLTDAENHIQKLLIDERISYKLNNYAHRSENFNQLDQTKNNLLFAGCSSTFGVGLPEKYVWSQQLYNTIQLKNKGPFQSIGIPAAGVEKIIHNIFKYCNKFGNPQYIYVAFPDYSREVKYLEGDSRLINHINVDYETLSMSVDSGHDVTLIFRFQLLYRLLEIYCKSNNITLRSVSWDSVTHPILKKIFPESFIDLDLELNNYIENFNIDSIDKEDRDLLAVARDGDHPGIIQQKRIADSFIINFMS